MFRFFKKKPAPAAEPPATEAEPASVPAPAASAVAPGPAPEREPEPEPENERESESAKVAAPPPPPPAEGVGWWRQAVGKITGRTAEPTNSAPAGAADDPPVPAPSGLSGSPTATSPAPATPSEPAAQSEAPAGPAAPAAAPPAAIDAPAQAAASDPASMGTPAPAPSPAPVAGAPAEPVSVAPPLPNAPNAVPPAPTPVGPAQARPAVAGAAQPLAQTPQAGVAARQPSAPQPVPAPLATPVVAPAPDPVPTPLPERQSWVGRLRKGLSRTGQSLAQVFTGTRIDEALYEELEDALLMADTGVKATQFLLDDLRRRVKEAKATDPAAVKRLLVDALADLLAPLEKGLEIGRHEPTVMMVVGVNGAGKTTSIGKLTKHLADADQTVLLAAADTFRAAAREQLGVWADRNKVEIVSQVGADPAAVSFDAVTAGKARKRDVVIADTAGRLPTQIHLMEELKKIQRVIGKADAGAPHEVLLVVDGNTGQNALTQVKAFDDALKLTGLIVTKLDGTAKGGVLAAIARERPVPVYFIGVGEQIEDLQTFSAREFAQALLN